MSGGENRIGTVSSVDPKTGMVSVLYEDRDGAVTDLLPYATFNDEYKLPQQGAKVIVMHLSNGSEMGIVLGTYWNESNAAGAPGAYHKSLGKGASFCYDGNVLTITAEHIRLVASEDGEDFTVAELMADIRRMKEKLGIA